MTTITSEAIFVVPIDLEASLGKIDDGMGQQDMDCEPVTRTSSNNPFKGRLEEGGEDQHIISPYPYSETDAEIKERLRLEEAGVTSWSSAMQTTDATKESLELIPDDGDDDFSLSEEEAGSLSEEDLQLEKIEDPASFWDSAAANQPSSPNVIPFSVSFSSACDSSQRTLGH